MQSTPISANTPEPWLTEPQRRKERTMPTKTKGTQWAQRVRDEYELNEAQDVLVDICADIIDILEDPHLPIVERRQQQLALMKGLSQLGLPDADGAGGDVVPLTASQRGRKAAQARWSDKRNRKVD
jgi:hypothetical protein